MPIRCRICGDDNADHLPSQCPLQSNAVGAFRLPDNVPVEDAAHEASEASGSAENMEKLLGRFRQPDMDFLKRETLNLANREELQKALKLDSDKAKFEFVRKGGMWNQSHVTDIIVLFRCTERCLGSLDKRLMCSLAGVMKNVLEITALKVKIRYAQETLDGALLGSRKEVEFSYQDIYDNKLQDLSGQVEALSFFGYIKIRLTGCGDPDGSDASPDLVLKTVFTFLASEDDKEDVNDRFGRMKNYCMEGEFMSVARNLRSLLNPKRLLDHFRSCPQDFPDIINAANARSELHSRAKKLRDQLHEAIEACGHLDSVRHLLQAAQALIADQDLPDYCASHFGLHGMTSERIASVIDFCNQKIQKQGKGIIQYFAAQCKQVIPASELPGLLECFVDSFGVGQWQLRLNSFPAKSRLTAWDSAEGDETVLVVQLKHVNRGAILRNIGYEFSGQIRHETRITWQNDDSLSEDQRTLKEIAWKMCLRSLVPPGVVEGEMQLSDVTLKPEDLVEHCFLKRKGVPREEWSAAMPLPTICQKLGCLQLPQPSLSPLYGEGILVCMTPYVTRDLPEMITECIRRGIRVGCGTLICSQHLYGLFMSVLNPTQEVEILGQIAKPGKPTAFEESQLVLDHPRNPAGHFRHQGKLQAKAKTNIGLRLAESTSIETRPTYSTGDVPKVSSSNRPSACDRPHRQSLKGSLRADGMHFRPKNRASADNADLKSQWEVDEAWALEEEERRLLQHEEECFAGGRGFEEDSW
eukprot:gnl/MRDRNA2_/MRDRNA2_57724_c0_seq1.p1 gnl/MRDRNA2_/MRDRNA2_57724_c0~~gnl/MRDRNA2_/MRDRNA2_57724_c0_seq1.p1  ORF type:complete len:753 (+),score=130.59 gnl/MRDRNA2_/MRDRNA2_57724_c0_seq1:76-2334(+)